MEPTGLAAILAHVTSIVTAAVSWCGSYLGMITTSGNEILLLFTVLPIVGLGIGILKRLFSVN